MAKRKINAPPTARGVATRARIVEAASTLVAEHGVAGTRIEDVMEASGTSKSQVYHYFADREALMSAVVQARSQGVLEFQSSSLDKVRTLEDLRAWRDKVVAINRRKGSVGGCPMGSLASELADRSESAREILLAGFDRWKSSLRKAFEVMQRDGQLTKSADPDALAVRFLIALQGGLLLSQTMRSSVPLEAALDLALEHVGPVSRDNGLRNSRLKVRTGTGRNPGH
jgi:TetR/AcrR family transcriptional repressor of nem operon